MLYKYLMDGVPLPPPPPVFDEDVSCWLTCFIAALIGY